MLNSGVPPLMLKKTSVKKIKEEVGVSFDLPLYVSDKAAKPTHISILKYDSAHLDIIQNASFEQCVADKGGKEVVWIRVVGLADIRIINELCEAYGIHPLIRENIFNMDQRTKCDVFDEYVFISVKAHAYNKQSSALSTEQVSIAFGENFVLSFEEKENKEFDSTIARLEKQHNIIRSEKADFLAYDLIDVIVDSYYKIFENIGDYIEYVEGDIIEKTTPELVRKIHKIKRKLIILRKSLWPTRDILNNLLRKQTPLVSEKTIFYLRDTYDHIVQLIDNVETYRDLLAGLLDFYMLTVSNHMNEIMKVLTVFASIFIPLTFIVGLYGMNFNVSKSPFNMPELNWYYGYPFALSLMVLTVIGMLIFFKRRKWF